MPTHCSSCHPLGARPRCLFGDEALKPRILPITAAGSHRASAAFLITIFNVNTSCVALTG
jgi:hypothetical protein